MYIDQVQHAARRGSHWDRVPGPNFCLRDYFVEKTRDHLRFRPLRIEDILNLDKSRERSLDLWYELKMRMTRAPTRNRHEPMCVHVGPCNVSSTSSGECSVEPFR